MNERLKKVIFIVIGVFSIFFLFLFMLSGCKGTITPKDLESLIVEKTEGYYSLHKTEFI